MTDTPKRRGRPCKEPRAAICVKVPATTYDAAYRQAAREGVTVPELFRRGLRARLDVRPPVPDIE